MPACIGKSEVMPPYGLWPYNMQSMFTTTHLETMPFVLLTYLLTALYRAIVCATSMYGEALYMSLTPNFNRGRNCLDGKIALVVECSLV
jgi:hypothetical protein